jgi:hypothetical protein
MDWIMVLAFFAGGVAIGAAVTEKFGLRPNKHTVTIPQGGDTWITVDLGPGRPQARVNLLNTSEGLILDMYGYHQDEPVASTWATDDDILEGN